MSLRVLILALICFAELISATSACDCGLEPTLPAATSSRQTFYSTKHPWLTLIASVYRPPDRPHWVDIQAMSCGGVILDKRHVLTAPNCPFRDDQIYGEKEIFIGYHNHRQNLDKFSYYHNPYDSNSEQVKNFEYDTFELVKSEIKRLSLPIVKLAQDLEWKHRVSPVCLPKFSDPIPDQLTIVGWSDPSLSDQQFTGVSPREIVISLTGESSESSPKICGVDHGSPVMFKENGRWQLVGIVNFPNVEAKCIDVYEKKPKSILQKITFSGPTKFEWITFLKERTDLLKYFEKNMEPCFHE